MIIVYRDMIPCCLGHTWLSKWCSTTDLRQECVPTLKKGAGSFDNVGNYPADCTASHLHTFSMSSNKLLRTACGPTRQDVHICTGRLSITSQRTQHVSITRTVRVMLFANTLCEQHAGYVADYDIEHSAGKQKQFGQLQPQRKTVSHCSLWRGLTAFPASQAVRSLLPSVNDSEAGSPPSTTHQLLALPQPSPLYSIENDSWVTRDINRTLHSYAESPPNSWSCQKYRAAAIYRRFSTSTAATQYKTQQRA